MFKKCLQTDRQKATFLIRLMVGVVFLSEGIQKFLFPAVRGAGRFESIGLPAPELLGPIVGGFEILCGSLVILGFLTRFAGIPLVIIMLVALFTTKLEILHEEGFWSMMHAARTDWAMLLGCLYLLIRGGGYGSLDYRVSGKYMKKHFPVHS